MFQVAPVVEHSFESLHAPLGDGSPDKEHDNGADDGADEPGTLAGRIPSKRLPEIARNDRSPMPRIVVNTKPEGSLLPGMMNLAITPAINPMTIVQMIPMACS
jgi:hypothetical protein